MSDKGYVYVDATKSVRKFPKELKLFGKEVGVPVAIISDSHMCQKSKEVKQFSHKIGTTLRILEGGAQWTNRAALYFGLFKELVHKYMHDGDYPMVFWDYCAERRSSVTNMTAKDLFQLRGNTPYFATFGEEGDISNTYQFGW